MVTKKKKTKIVKKKTEVKPKEIITEKSKEEKHKTYWRYYSVVIFLIFAVLFIAILIIATLAVFGSRGLWLVIPATVILWGISYVLAKIFFKKKDKK